MNYKVIGPPGTGKTHTLLEKVKENINKGTPLTRIGYFAFTRKAAYEARDRFLKEFPNLVKKDLKYFQTLHSFCFNYLGLKEEDVIQEDHYRSIGETIGVRINYANYEKNEYNGIFTSNSEYLNIVNLASVRKISALDQLDRNEHLGKIERYKLRLKSKITTQNRLDIYIQGRLGCIMDGTARDYAKISRQQRLFNFLGYQTIMIFVNTSKEVALERNEKRDRTVPRADAIKNWNIVQSNMGKFQKLFQPANFYVVDNSRSEKELVTATLNRCASIVRRTMKSPHNFIAKQWINRQLRIKKGDINPFFKGKL